MSSQSSRARSLTLALAALLAMPLAAQTQRFQPSLGRVVKLRPSRPLTEMPPLFTGQGHRLIPLLSVPRRPASSQTDPVVQSTVGLSLATTTENNFLGVGEGFSGPQGSFTVRAAPPDTNGDVGDTQYVQWVNLSFAVFDKNTGLPVYGPVAGNTLWQGSGLTACEQTNDGDPIALFDKLAHRWVMAQLSYSQAPPYYECIAISQTSDATGAYYRYALEWNNTLPDYPKWGAWPDAYYFSANLFTPFATSYLFVGAQACALDRNQMLQGLDATVQCFTLSNDASLLPADLDGPQSPPPSGAPGYFMSLASNALNLYRFHVDFANPSNTTLTGPVGIPVASFSEACGGGTCIPQPGTSQQLDSLGDRLMFRLAYRNFGDHESLVVTHSVNPGGGGGGGGGHHGHAPDAPGGANKPGGGGTSTAASAIRWYEIRNPAGTPAVYQQGTYSPDTDSRWMGSIAMDKAGDIAVGYSVSSGSLHPSVRFTGRVPSDALGTLEAESSVFEGSGSQLPSLNRWGDYSSMAVDPVDDCTFWYTNEFLATDGTFNWSTRIESFKFPGCQ